MNIESSVLKPPLETAAGVGCVQIAAVSSAFIDANLPASHYDVS